jgi:hypothetical protein
MSFEEKKIPKKFPTKRLPHVNRTYGCVVNLPHHHTCGTESYTNTELLIVVYYESRKGELKIMLMNEGRYDERLKTSVEESTCLTYTGEKKKSSPDS